MDIKKKYNENGFIIIKNLIKKNIFQKYKFFRKFKKRNTYYYTQNNHNWVKSGEISKQGYLIQYNHPLNKIIAVP